MDQTFFSVLANALSGTQHRLNVAIESAPNSGLKVLVTADLGPTPDKASEDEIQLRAAMCRPVILTGSAGDVEQALIVRLTKHVRALDEGSSLLDEIQKMRYEVREKATKAPNEAPKKADGEEQQDSEEQPTSGPASATSAPKAEQAPALADNLFDCF